MKNSLDRSEFEKMMIATQREAEIVHDRVNTIIQERWIDDKNHGQIQAVSGEVIAEMDRPVTRLIDVTDYVALWQKLGYSSLVKLSDNICLARKPKSAWRAGSGSEEIYTLTDHLGTILPLEIPGKSSKIRWFDYCYPRGDGIIFCNDWLIKEYGFFRYSKIDGKYTGIRDMHGNDLSPKIVGFWCTEGRKETGIHIKDWLFSNTMFWHINDQWVLFENTTPRSFDMIGDS